MRTILTTYDLRNIIDGLFNGNLWAYKASNGAVAYENPNSETIALIDAENGSQTETDLAEYLNIRFYSWKDRLVSVSDQPLTDNVQPYSVLDDWVRSLNLSMNQAYALVEKTDSEVVASQDIDSATIMGQISFLVQTDKVPNLDYYISKIRSKYLGAPQEIQNSFGDIIKAFIMIGDLQYTQEPFMTQLGECIIVTSNFRISYLADALSYSDTEIGISLDGDDILDDDGNIVDANGQATETKYLSLPITKATWQNIFGAYSQTTQNRPDLSGSVANSLSTTVTLSFYDYNKTLTTRLNDLFWRCGCIKYDGATETAHDINIPVFVRVKSNGHTYVYKDMISSMGKTIQNGDFNISTLTLKAYAKI